MALIRALRELELFHFLQRSTECRRCLLILACDSAFSRWSAARVEIQRAPGESERGAEGGVVEKVFELETGEFLFFGSGNKCNFHADVLLLSESLLV